MSRRGIFVTGTDTGVGKTVVAATLARLLALRGLRVGVMKPVTSGCGKKDGQRFSEDSDLLAWGASSTLPQHLRAPYLLRDPIAPAEAAAREGVVVSFDRLEKAFEEIAAASDFTIVEGAGGLMVPLAGGLLVADLAARLELPLLVVTRPNLGTINHTLLTTFAARHLGLAVAGLIIANYPKEPGLAEETAPHQLDVLSGVPILGILPTTESRDQHELVESLAAHLATAATTPILLRELGL
jgi:dethiobiotin synthetase